MNMNRKYLILSTLVIGLFVSPQIAKADICDAPTMAASSASPIEIKILDTDIGTAAYDRLEAYGNGGHDALGRAIGAAHNWFGNCTYPGIGLGIGSGGNGFRKNITLWIWQDGVDSSIARAAIYLLVSAEATPTVTSGDCAISCDGTTAADRVRSTDYLSTNVEAPPTPTAQCDSPSQGPESSSSLSIQILDSDVGTAAYDRLEAYGNGGHDALGRAIGAAHNWFGNCTYPGIGLGIGSGGNGFRKNFNIAIWMDGVSAATARQAIYALISAPTNPVTTNGDCAISCDAPSEAINVNSNITETSVAPIEAPAVSDSPLVIASVANPFLTNAVPKQIITPKRNLVVSKKKVTKKVSKGHARVS